jgi:NADP-dependent 3-hydroxy acid dehydrogenase YdfG
MVETEFSRFALRRYNRAENVYKGFTPLQAEDIADIIHFVTRPIM